jgi:hypothetical protein
LTIDVFTHRVERRIRIRQRRGAGRDRVRERAFANSTR